MITFLKILDPVEIPSMPEVLIAIAPHAAAGACMGYGNGLDKLF